MLDIGIAGGAMVAAALVSLLPDGNPLRAAVALPVLLVAPGYLALQAISHRPRHDALHFMAAIGLSLPLVGLLALATSTVPGGFTVGAIVVVVTLGCLTLGGVAYIRRAAVAA